jgi:hypothetical protein
MGFWQKPKGIFKLEKWVFQPAVLWTLLIGLLSRVVVGFRIVGLFDRRRKHYLLGLLESRMEFLYGDAIGVAFLLDPRYLGDWMSAQERKKVEYSLFNFKPEQRETMFLEYTNYMIQASK